MGVTTYSGCTACCGGIASPCCSDSASLPTTLHATFSHPSGLLNNCFSCLLTNGPTYTITYANPSAPDFSTGWANTQACGGGTLEFGIACIGTTWHAEIYCDGVLLCSTTAAASACATLHLVFTFSMAAIANDCCNNQAGNGLVMTVTT